METGTLVRDGSSRAELHARAELTRAAPAAPPPRLSIRDLRVGFAGAGQTLDVVHGVDLDIPAGRTLGIVGESGCGKSVTMLAAMGLLGKRGRARGSVTIDGAEILGLPEPEMERVRGKRIAMIFQDPMSSLNPVHRIGTQIAEALALHRGMGGAPARAEAARLLDRVGIASARQRLNEYPHQLSGGMNQRAMIAMALAGEPDVLIADEPTTALDVTIQAQILELLRDIQRDEGMSIALITHDLGVVAEMADAVAVMYCGRIVERASAADLFAHPRHPYTRGLLASLPRLDRAAQALRPIPGAVPDAANLPAGCAFAPRCPSSAPACAEAPPELREAAPGHRVACPFDAQRAAA
jgi:peptide/nickel transport system ATP-binding protein